MEWAVSGGECSWRPCAEKEEGSNACKKGGHDPSITKPIACDDPRCTKGPCENKPNDETADCGYDPCAGLPAAQRAECLAPVAPRDCKDPQCNVGPCAPGSGGESCPDAERFVICPNGTKYEAKDENCVDINYVRNPCENNPVGNNGQQCKPGVEELVCAPCVAGARECPCACAPIKPAPNNNQPGAGAANRNP